MICMHDTYIHISSLSVPGFSVSIVKVKNWCFCADKWIFFFFLLEHIVAAQRATTLWPEMCSSVCSTTKWGCIFQNTYCLPWQLIGLINNYLRGGWKEDRTILFSLVPSARTRWNGHTLGHSNIRMHLTMWVMEHWHKLPKEATESPWRSQKSHSSMMQCTLLLMSLLEQVLDQIGPEVPASLSHSVTL